MSEARLDYAIAVLRRLAREYKDGRLCWCNGPVTTWGVARDHTQDCLRAADLVKSADTNPRTRSQRDP